VPVAPSAAILSDKSERHVGGEPPWLAVFFNDYQRRYFGLIRRFHVLTMMSDVIYRF
jgi:hypothetical protein